MVNYILKKVKKMANNNYDRSYQAKFEFALNNFDRYQKEVKFPIKK